MTEDSLLGCPFCGAHTATQESCHRDHGVKCGTCKAFTRGSTPGGARDAWNKRHKKPELVCGPVELIKKSESLYEAESGMLSLEVFFSDEYQWEWVADLPVLGWLKVLSSGSSFSSKEDAAKAMEEALSEMAKSLSPWFSTEAQKSE